MNKLVRKLFDIGADLACYALIGAFTFTCIGACIWSAKWVLNLLGVM